MQWFVGGEGVGDSARSDAPDAIRVLSEYAGEDVEDAYMQSLMDF